MITIFADKHLYKLDSFLPPNVQLNYYDPQNGLPEQMDGIDALLIRTVTKIDAVSLARIPESLKFIGTGSAGRDHVDTQLLREKGITFASAAGCNARAVAEYVATALLIWADEKSRNLSECSVGIVGAGHVGSSLKNILGRLNISVVVYDPPRELRDPHFVSAGIEDVLRTDILTFHTPLTPAGTHPTLNWLDSEKLYGRSFDLIINTSRGGVVNEQAVLSAHAEGKVKDMIIDVWDGEPVFNDELARRAFIKTPHIAGYSVQAKLNASRIIAEKLMECFKLSLPDTHAYPQAATQADIPDSVQSISDALACIHPILDYQKGLTGLIGTEPPQKRIGFNKLRTGFPLRNEYAAMDVPDLILDYYPSLKALFQ